MKVSILTITRDNPEDFRRTLESVRSQSLPRGMELEHVVVDSSAADVADSIRLLCRYGEVYAWTKPEGIYPAMNRALAMSTGEVIGILNSGDVFADTGAIARVVSAMAEPSVDFILSDVVFFGSKRYYSGEKFTVASMEHGIAPPHPSFYARRKVYDALGTYDEQYRIVADFDFFARLMRHPEFNGLYVPGPLVVMEPGGTSQSLFNRLGSNTVEKFHSLKVNGFRAGWLRLYSRFFLIIYTQYIIRHSK